MFSKQRQMSGRRGARRIVLLLVHSLRSRFAGPGSSPVAEQSTSSGPAVEPANAANKLFTISVPVRRMDLFFTQLGRGECRVQCDDFFHTIRAGGSSGKPRAAQ